MEKKKIQVIKKYIFIFFILCIVLTSIFIMIRYQVEGEENMPFKLKEVIVKSSIEPKSVEEDNLWESILSQENDIFITIAKEDSAKGDTKIQKVVIDNFKIKKTSDKFNFNI